MVHAPVALDSEQAAFSTFADTSARARTPENPLRGMCQPDRELSGRKKISAARYCPDCDTDLSQIAEIVRIPHRHTKKSRKIVIK